MVIVDTSVWIDFFGGKHTKNTDFLRKVTRTTLLKFQQFSLNNPT